MMTLAPVAAVIRFHDPEEAFSPGAYDDTPFGAALRSCFLLGTVDGKSVPDAIGLGLLQHCSSEFGYLSRCLPSLYWADPANRADVPPMW